MLVMVAQFCDYTKSHWIAYIKKGTFMVYELDQKIVLKNVEAQGPHEGLKTLSMKTSFGVPTTPQDSRFISF